MTLTLTFLDARSSFELAVFFITWVALAGLALIGLQLHFRLRRVEQGVAQGAEPAGPPAPYAHLLGRSMGDRLESPDGALPRLLLFLSSACPTCSRILQELSDPTWSRSAAVAFTDEPPSSPELPEDTRLLDRGRELSEELGISVTPFALVLDSRGRTVRAAPITRLSSLHDLALHGATS